MFVAVGPSGHFLIVSWSACALSNKGNWFPMFIFEVFLGALEVRISQSAVASTGVLLCWNFCSVLRSLQIVWYDYFPLVSCELALSSFCWLIRVNSSCLELLRQIARLLYQFVIKYCSRQI